LIKHRDDVGINERTPFVFAAPTRDSVNALRGYEALATITNKVNIW